MYIFPRATSFISMTIICLLIASSFSNASDPSGYLPGKVVLRKEARCSLSELNGIFTYFGGSIEDSLPFCDRYYLSLADTNSVDTLLLLLKQDSCVIWAERVYPIIWATNDLLFGQQWHLENHHPQGQSYAHIYATQAWAIEKGIALTTVGVFDTGIPWNSNSPNTNHLTHEDLQNSSNNYPFYLHIPPDQTIQDDNGHGTHVLGVLSAITNNSLGVAGVLRGATIFVYKGEHNHPIQFREAIEDLGLQDIGHTKIMNLSGGSSNPPDYMAWREDIARAIQLQILVVAANGNIGENEMVLAPAIFADEFDNIIAVGGTDVDDNYHTGARTQAATTVAAPFGSFPSCEHGGDYSGFQGTSAATPIVTGVAALVLSQARESGINLTPAEIRDILTASSDDCNYAIHPGHDEYMGSGRVNAFKALLRTPGAKELESSLTINPHHYDLHSPYYIAGSLVVPAGDTLTLQPGVRLTFAPNAFLQIEGTLIAQGAAQDSIRFEGYNHQEWAGIFVLGGAAHLSYTVIKDATVPLFASSPTGTNPPITLYDAILIGGHHGLDFLGGAGAIYDIKRVRIQDVPDVSGYSGLHFSNANVYCEDVEVINSAYRTAYIYNTSGRFTRCTFSGRASHYGLHFSGSLCNAVFKCSKVDYVAPSVYPATTIWCTSSAAPTFGQTGSSIINNRIVDDGTYLVKFSGNSGLPVLGQFWNTLINDNLANGAKLMRWDNTTALPGTYNATKIFWNTTPQLSYFYPAISSYWNYCCHLTANPDICPQGSLDDFTVLDSAYYYESNEQWQEAQTAFLNLAQSDRLALSERVNAMSHAITVDRMLNSLSLSEVENSVNDLISLAPSVSDSLNIGKLTLYYLADKAEYDEAISGFESLLLQNLTPVDSLLTVIDILQTELLAEESGNNKTILQANRLQKSQAIDEVFHQIVLLSQDNPAHSSPAPSSFSLSAFPNPFNPSTNVRFSVTRIENVKLRVYDLKGRLVETLTDELYQPGYYSVEFDGAKFPSGIYFARMETGAGYTEVKKLVLLK